MCVCVSVCVCVAVKALAPLSPSSGRRHVRTTATLQRCQCGMDSPSHSLHASPAAPPIRQPKQLFPTRTFTLSLLARTKKRAFTDRTTLPLLVVVAVAGTLLVWSSCPTSQPPTQHKRKLPRTVHCGLSHQTPRWARLAV